MFHASRFRTAGWSPSGGPAALCFLHSDWLTDPGCPGPGPSYTLRTTSNLLLYPAPQCPRALASLRRPAAQPRRDLQPAPTESGQIVPVPAREDKLSSRRRSHSSL